MAPLEMLTRRRFRLARFVIAVLIILIFAGTLYYVFVEDIVLDEVKEKLAFILIGGLMTNMTTIVGFYFTEKEEDPPPT